jgi:hypothetical protein
MTTHVRKTGTKKKVQKESVGTVSHQQHKYYARAHYDAYRQDPIESISRFMRHTSASINTDAPIAMTIAPTKSKTPAMAHSIVAMRIASII